VPYNKNHIQLAWHAARPAAGPLPTRRALALCVSSHADGPTGSTPPYLVRKMRPSTQSTYGVPEYLPLRVLRAVQPRARPCVPVRLLDSPQALRWPTSVVGVGRVTAQRWHGCGVAGHPAHGGVRALWRAAAAARAELPADRAEDRRTHRFSMQSCNAQHAADDMQLATYDARQKACYRRLAT
jgi:hypothetical protein